MLECVKGEFRVVRELMLLLLFKCVCLGSRFDEWRGMSSKKGRGRSCCWLLLWLSLQLLLAVVVIAVASCCVVVVVVVC